MRTIWLTILLAGCGQEPPAEETTPEPAAEEKGGTPAKEQAPVAEPKPVVDEQVETKAERLIDADELELGLYKYPTVRIAGSWLDVDLHQGFTKPNAGCFFKEDACEGDCYSMSETVVVLDATTVFTKDPESKKDLTITAKGVKRPWKSETSATGCQESQESQSSGSEKYIVLKLQRFTLPLQVTQ